MKTTKTGRKVTRVIAFVIIGLFFLTMISLPSNAQAAAGGWDGSGTVLNSGPGPVNGASIAMDGNGNAVAVWAQFDGAHDSIYANSYSAGVWGKAMAIESGTGEASSPHVAMDENGNAIVIWQQNDGRFDSIYANRYTDGAWGTAIPIENSAGEATSPEIGMSSNGNAAAVWLQNVSGSNFSVYAAVFSGSSWGGAKVLENGTSEAIDPQVAIDGNGNAIAVWLQNAGTDPILGNVNGVYYNRFTMDAWGAAKLMENLTGESLSTRIAADNNGNAIVLWIQHWEPPGGGQDQYGAYTSHFSSEAWGTPILLGISSEFNFFYDPQIVVNSKGDAVVVLEARGSLDDRNVYATTYVSGAWSALKVLTPDLTEAGGARVAMDDNDNIIVMWFQFDTGDGPNDPNNGINYARYHSGAWSAPIKLIDGDAVYQIAMDNQGHAIALLAIGGDIVALQFFPGTWGVANLVEHQAGFASQPQEAMASNGDAIVVWQQFDGGHDSVYSRMYVGGVWGPVTLVEHGTGDAWSPQVAMNDQGNAIVVWQQYDGSSHLSLYAKCLTSGIWGPVKLLEYASGDAWSPQVALDCSGNSVVVWTQYDSSSHLSVYARQFSSGSWGPVTALENGNGNAWSPQVAMDCNGNTIVVWSQLDGTFHMNVYAKCLSSGTWGAVTSLKAGSGEATSARIAMDCNGNAIAVWSQTWWPSDGGQELSGIYADHFSSGAWGTPKLLEKNSVNNNLYAPEIAINDKGEATAVWIWRASLDFRAVHVASYSSGAWGPVKELASVFGGVSSAQVAMASNGDAIVVWAGNDDSAGVSHSRIDAVRFNGSNWSAAMLLDSGTGDASAPQVAMDSNGNAIAVWEQNDGASESIYANIFDAVS